MDLDESAFVPDYDEAVLTELPAPLQREVKVATRRATCPLCPMLTRHVGEHCLKAHLPWYVGWETACPECKVQCGRARVLRKHVDNKHYRPTEHNMAEVLDHMSAFVQSLYDEVSGNVPIICSLYDMFIFVEEEHPQACARVASEQERELGWQLEEHMGVDVDAARLSLMFRWQVLVTLLKVCSEEFCTHFQEGEPNNGDLTADTEAGGSFTSSVSSQPSVGPAVVDTHCHLDMIDRRCQGVPVDHVPDGSVMTLGTIVANFVYPEYWRRMETLVEKYSQLVRVRCTVGIHPHLAFSTPESRLDELSRMIDDACVNDNTCIAGIGEAGIDFTSSPFSLDRQKQVFGFQVLQANRSNLTLVIHSRDKDVAGEALATCRQVMQESGLPRTHPIHLHCVSAPLQCVQELLAEYPNLYVGMGPQVFRKELLPLVCQIPLRRMVLESDAPYFRGVRWMSGRPGVVAEVAEFIAEKKGLPLYVVLYCTLANATHLYRL